MPAGHDESAGEEHGDPGYRGPATVLIDETEVAVRVDLRGCFQPVDGCFHWYGRIEANPELDRLVTEHRAQVRLRTPNGERPAELSDPDLWGRYRLSGTGTPPFEVDSGVDSEMGSDSPTG